MVKKVKAVWTSKTDTNVVDNKLKSVKIGSIPNFTKNYELAPKTLMSVIESRYRYVYTQLANNTLL
jgi:hypothetical protein